MLGFISSWWILCTYRGSASNNEPSVELISVVPALATNMLRVALRLSGKGKLMAVQLVSTFHIVMLLVLLYAQSANSFYSIC
jgi:hypothetical protein